MPDRLFYCDPATEQRISYERFAADVAMIDTVPAVFQADDCYKVFCMIMAAIQNDATVALADSQATLQCSDSSHAVVAGRTVASAEMDMNPGTVASGKTAQRSAVDCAGVALGNEWKESNARIGIYTSGTSGRPKLIEHSVATLTRGVRTGAHHARDVWGFAYHPTHFAGLQVLFQAVANCNPLIRLFGLEHDQIHAAIEHWGITHLSATPTFFKMLCNDKICHPRVVRVTTGGEIARDSLKAQIARTFPNAKRLDVYASTEAGSLLVAEGDFFRVPDSLSGLVKVIDGELAIHRSLLADSLRKTLRDDYFMTGDFVQIVNESPLTLRIESRKSDMINVGGYKVNPHEVEQLLLEREEIADARVYGLANSVTGNIVGCDLVAKPGMSIDKAAIRNFLQSKLSAYQLPRLINVVSEIKASSTGKLVRKYGG